MTDDPTQPGEGGVEPHDVEPDAGLPGPEASSGSAEAPRDGQPAPVENPLDGPPEPDEGDEAQTAPVEALDTAPGHDESGGPESPETPEAGLPGEAPPPPGAGRPSWMTRLRPTPSSVVTVVALAAILTVAAYLRFQGVNWDDGHHLHPDERFLTMVESSLTMPDDFAEYFDTQSSRLNPRNTGHELFVYGTLPINLVFVVAHRLNQTSYWDVYLIGRKLMAVFDLLAIVLIFLIGSRLYDRRIGLLAAALSAFTAFQIQQSHFFTVDTAANVFVLLFFLAAIGMMKGGRKEDVALAGLAMGLALASKSSSWPIVPLGVLALLVSEHRRGATLGRDWVRLAGEIALLGVTAFLTLRIAQPDMWVGPGWAGDTSFNAPDWWFLLHDLMPDVLEPLFLPDPRWAENMHRVAGMVTGYGMDWPPNHQWWNRVAYWFPWRNIVAYGLGVPLGIAATVAWAVAGYRLLRGDLRHFLPWMWVTFIFLYQGRMWVKTMRYFLPIYPMLILMAAWMLIAFYDWTRASPGTVRSGRRWLARLRSPAMALALGAIVLGGTIVWGFMVSRIYARDHSRVAGSRWIYHNVPAPVTLTTVDFERGPYLPVSASTSLQFSDYIYTVEDDSRLEPSRVIVPGESPVTIDGVQLAYLSDPVGDPSPERVRAWLTTSGFRGDSGDPSDVLAEADVELDLPTAPSPDDPHVRVPLPETTLEPGGEYYLWLDVEGAPVSGRMPVLAVETTWDDHIPLGLDGYAAWDNRDTPQGEGFYGQVNLDLYDEDDAGKAQRIAERLDQADYIVPTSNRVYGSVAQLPDRFPMTIEYYDRLFSDELGFERVADIHSYPNLGPFEVNDQPADEAWHVYDHPQVDVFAKTPEFDSDALQASLEPYAELRTWTWPEDQEGALGSLFGRVRGLLPLGGAQVPDDLDARPPPEAVMLSSERKESEERGGTWSALFDPDSLINRSPLLASLLWYLVLAAVGVIAFPILATALPNLPDRGWSVARIGGLLLTSWLAWLLASVTPIPHTPGLVVAALGVVALLAVLAVWRTGDSLAVWLREQWPLLLTQEVIFAAVFALFLLIRIGNPDLWHPYYGGEKPMDLAYLNATLRTSSFPPYDPWFAGGQMNYYYYGFVLVGALIELTRIVPWIAYNLAVPSLAAMTGIGVFGAVYNWTRRSDRGRGTAALSGLVGLVLAVVAGNLYQVQFIIDKIGEHGATSMVSSIPGLQRVLQVLAGWRSVVSGESSLSVPTGHWYWNASRAIPDVPGDVQPITEFPFFTFLYADLHAHMMALPLTVLAFVIALSWVLPVAEDGAWRGWPWRGLRLLLGALAIGALWPANTWDYPTYGLVAAGAIAIGQWVRHGGLSWAWARDVAVSGLALLGLSLVLFLPYHNAYVQPYADFQRWTSIRTPASAYLTIHGIFLFAIVSWAVYRVWGDLRDPEARRVTLRNMMIAGTATAIVFAALWYQSVSHLPVDKMQPTIWTPLIGAVLITLGATLLVRPSSTPAERFGAWLLLLGALLGQFVEHVVLAGDIGRMNTVFKFYIQVWVLWSALAGASMAWLTPALRRSTWGAWWRAAFAILIAAGLVYTVTASRAKIQDRFPAMGPLTVEERAAFERQQGPGLSGAEYQDYVVYDDNGNNLRLSYDRDAFEWLLENVEGTPVILEGFRDAGYRWGARYSINTGLPTVIGWDWHQKQQRNAVGHGVVDERTRDVRIMYDSPDTDEVLALLDKYAVRYVIVGEMERAFYDREGLAKFDRFVDEGLAELVYEDGLPGEPAVQIYRVAPMGERGG